MLPSEIQAQLAELTAENAKGFEALYQAEVRLAEAEHLLDTVEQRAFIKHQGTVADRNALARLEAAGVRSLETAIMASGTQAKLIQSELRA